MGAGKGPGPVGIYMMKTIKFHRSIFIDNLIKIKMNCYKSDILILKTPVGLISMYDYIKITTLLYYKTFSVIQTSNNGLG